MIPSSHLSIRGVKRNRRPPGSGPTTGADAASSEVGTEESEDEDVTSLRATDDSSIVPFESPGIKPLTYVLPFDPWRAVHALWRSRYLAIIVGCLLAIVAFVAARFVVKPRYKASTQLVRQLLPDTYRATQSGESYKPAEIPIPVLTSSIMRGRPLMERAGKASDPETSAAVMMAGIDVTIEKKSEVIVTTFSSMVSAARAVSLVNTFADEVVKYTRELQAQDASEVNDFLKQQITRCDIDLDRANEDLLRYAKISDLVDADKEMDSYLSERANFDLKYESMRIDHDTLDLKIQSVERELAKVSPAAARLQNARGELVQLLTRYTDLNPIVQEQRERIAALEEELKTSESATEAAPPQGGENSIAGSLYLQRVELLSQKKVLGEQKKQLETLRNKLTEKLQQLPRKSLEYAVLRSKRQTLASTREILASRQREAQLYMANPIGYYRVLQPASLGDVAVDSRRSTKAIFAAAGFAFGFFIIAALVIARELADSRVKTPADLRRVTRLPVLATLPLQTSDTPAALDAWAFRTWTRLHSKLRHGDGALVCGVLSDGDSESAARMSALLAHASAVRGSAVLVVTTRPPEGEPTITMPDAVSRAMDDADQWLSKCSGTVFLHVNESWTWSPGQRALFRDALGVWSRRRNAVIFVELPPADLPEALLTAEMLPQLLWVSASGKKPSTALSQTLATYRDAGCKVLGALLDRAPTLSPSMINQFAGTAALLVVGLSLSAAQAEDRPAELVKLEDIKSVGGTKPLVAKPAEPRGLTLGAGDKVNITMFGHPELERKEVPLKPDGRLTYLQAQDIMAAGLTIDELREALNKELRKYYTRPTCMVTPFQFQSRYVYVLGKVVKKGMVNFDRPLTLLEAITEAGGLETGLFQQNTVELADLGRSFLSRKGERVKVDFEALFARGDMSQNVMLQPDDYIYFPSANNNEVYVIGNVRSQGTQGLLGQSSVTSVITLAGGFNSRAYRDRVLVVRGSLDKPKTFAIDMNAVLAGRAKGFKLEPNDIVYIADKPWARAEELLDLAITTFLQGATTGYTSRHIGPLIKKPFISSDP